MKLEYFLKKYIVVTKKDGKKISGILMDILEGDSEDMGFITLVIRQDNGKYKNTHLIEVETIGEVE